MDSPIAPLALVFWLCLFVVTFVYLIYPAIVLYVAQLFGPASSSASLAGDSLPVVSLLIAAHNEESDIEARVLNALALDYPADKLEIVVASDGSTDGTNDIVRRYADR